MKSVPHAKGEKKPTLSPTETSPADLPEVKVTITVRRDPVRRALLEKLLLSKEAAHAAD